jgi:hypothetical protein
MWQRKRLDWRGQERRCLRTTMRAAPRPSAVIRSLPHGIVIELSDGRVCTVAKELCRAKSHAIDAAVQWARRHGAASIEICD